LTETYTELESCQALVLAYRQTASPASVIEQVTTQNKEPQFTIKSFLEEESDQVPDLQPENAPVPATELESTKSQFPLLGPAVAEVSSWPSLWSIEVRSSEEKPYILAFRPELMAEQLTLMDAVSVLAGKGRSWVDFLFYSSGQSCYSLVQSQYPVQSFNPLDRVKMELILRVTMNI
jgi:hypothetical protein